MTRKHTLWIARLHDGQTRLKKHLIPLPSGIALNPHCTLEQPLPALASPSYDGRPVLSVHAGQPSRLYERLFDIFQRMALTDAADATIPVGTLRREFSRWITQYTTAPAPEPAQLADAIPLEMVHDLPTPESTHSYCDVKFTPLTWIYHAAQQEVPADGR